MSELRMFLQSIMMPGLLLLALMFGDLIFGIIVSIKQGRFEWEYLPQFLLSDGVWILVWGFAEGLLYFFKDLLPSAILTAIGTGLYLPVAGKIGASLLGHFSALGVLTRTLEKVAIDSTVAPDDYIVATLVEDREDAVG